MTNTQFNLVLALLIVSVSLATYLVTKTLQPSPLPLAVSMMSLSPEQLDAMDKQAAAAIEAGNALSAELQAALECSRAAKTPEAWKACAETR
jgi:hypothetical protein